MAGTARLQYPPNTRIIRVPCSARVDPLFVIRGLLRGADGVLVAGCHPGDCHHLEGNYLARRRFALLKSLLEYVGVEEGRVQFAWVSAAEGGKFAKLIADVTESVRALGPAQRLVKSSTTEAPWQMSRKP